MTNYDQNCTVVPPAQRPSGIGQNGRPETPLFGLYAAWLCFADELELRRLAKLHIRIEKKKAAMKELVGERQRIMNRCIRRMRRDQGKQ